METFKTEVVITSNNGHCKKIIVTNLGRVIHELVPEKELERLPDGRYLVTFQLTAK